MKWLMAGLAALVITAGGRDALADGPFLIQFQQPFTDYPNDVTTPQYLRDNKAFMERLPFDGTVLNTQIGWQLMKGRPRTYAEIDREFQPLQGLTFRKFRHNFAFVAVRKPADLFDGWGNTIDAFRLIAKVARDRGLKGVFFDNEEYTVYDDDLDREVEVNLWDYPDDVRYKSRPLRDYQNQARKRGRQIMQAMVEAFPDIVVIVLHGPYDSFQGTPDAIRVHQTGADGVEMRGPFFVGMVEGAGDQARVIDGGEFYALRGPCEFSDSYRYRKRDFAAVATGVPFLSDGARSVWAGRVGIGYGVYNLVFPGDRGLQMDPTIMRRTLRNALRSSDSYVWQYTEEMNWFRHGGIDQAWIDAAAAARQDAVAAPTFTAYCFDDVAAGDNRALDGKHAGIDFGTGQWRADNSESAGLLRFAYFTGDSTRSRSFTLPNDKFLRSIRLASGTGGTYVISDGVNPDRRGRLTANIPHTVGTGWSKPATRVTVTFSKGPAAGIDEILY